MATTDHYNILLEEKMIPPDQISLLVRAGALAEPKFILQQRFLFPAKPSRALLEPKFVLTDHYNDLQERFLVPSDHYPDLIEYYNDL